MNIGTIDQIKKSIWHAHHTRRIDNPIDFNTNVEDNVSLRFLYSDLTFTVINFLKDGFEILHQGDISSLTFSNLIPKTDEVILPLITLYGQNEYQFNVREEDSNKSRIFTINSGVEPTLKLQPGNNKATEHPGLIEITTKQCYLYSNNDLYLRGLMIGGVAKPSSEVILKTDKTLNFITTTNKEVIVNSRIKNVDNFYINNFSQVIYIIRGDQLLCSNGKNEMDLRAGRTERAERSWVVLMDKGASKIRFTTESYYDDDDQI